MPSLPITDLSFHSRIYEVSQHTASPELVGVSRVSARSWPGGLEEAEPGGGRRRSAAFGGAVRCRLDPQYGAIRQRCGQVRICAVGRPGQEPLVVQVLAALPRFLHSCRTVASGRGNRGARKMTARRVGPRDV